MNMSTQLAERIGRDKVRSDAERRHSRRYDQWCVKHLRDWRGEPVPAPGVVVRPESVADVRQVVLVRQ